MTTDSEVAAFALALALLSAEPEVQARSLDLLRQAAHELRSGVVDLHPVDERLRARGHLSPAQSDRIAAIDELLAAMVDDGSVWTAAALAIDPRWRRLRALAREALRSLGTKASAP